MTTTRPLVAYYRVSTDKQGKSGLGLDAQRRAVSDQAGACQIVAEYTEVESGKRSDRQQLARAIRHVKAIRGILLVAKLDRLARNVAFVSALIESGVDFICADTPDVNKLTIHILAAVAEDEAERISARTKAALAVARDERGIKLGSAREGHWAGREERRLAGAKAGAKVAGEAHREAADEFYSVSPAVAAIKELHGQGKGLRLIAKALEEAGHQTRRGNTNWNPSQVRSILDRLGMLN